MLKPKAWIHSLAPLTVVPSDDGDHEQREADGADEVAVAVELHVVAHDEHGEDEEAGADQQPLALRERQRRADAEDLGEPDGGQQGGDGQQERVGLRQEEAHQQVQQHEDADEDQAVDDGDAVDLAEAARVDGHVGHGAHGAGEDEEQQLQVAPAHGHIPSMLARASSASLAVAELLLVDERARRRRERRRRRRRCAGTRRAAGRGPILPGRPL